MLQIEDNGFDDLACKVNEYLKNVYGNEKKTFKVDARRARKNYPKNSMEINMDLGEKYLMLILNSSWLMSINRIFILTLR